MTGHGGPSALDHANIYEAVLAELEAAVLRAAPAKQVQMPQGHAAHVAEQAAELLDLPDHFRLLCRDDGAIRRAADAAHRAIDAHYFIQVGVRIAHHFGVPEAAASYVPIFVAGAVRGLHGESGVKQGYVWPDPDEFTAQMLLSQPSANLFWQPPDGGQANLWMRFWNASPGAPPSPVSLESEVHRPSREGPAVEHTTAAGEPVLKIYIEHGKRHRDPAEGPALFQRIEENGRVRLVTEYWVGGVQHQPSCEGPAIIETGEDGRILLEIYMEHGKRHRDPAEGPALLMIEETEGEEGPFVEYWQNGEQHRPAADGPAVRKTDMEGRVLLEVYFEHGKRHRDPADGPAFFKRRTEGAEVRLEYQYAWEGTVHRDASEGPASIETDANGRVLLEAYLEHGNYHRDAAHGPAILERDPSTGAVLREEYFRDGHLHRDEDEGPAVACFTPGSHAPHPHFEAYHCNGEPHRLAGPAIVVRCPETGAAIDEWHHRSGLLHRDDGPAIVLRHREGGIYYEAWHRNGELIEERGDPSGGFDARYESFPDIPTP